MVFRLLLFSISVMAMMPGQVVAQASSSGYGQGQNETVLTQNGMSIEVAARKHSALCNLQRLLASSNDELSPTVQQNLNLEDNDVEKIVNAAKRETNCQ